ncbi:MAG: DUF805 domain-containing protein, partial [Alphaproteobacteria bacterium]|nr:DUF805 domain-containing protein [Alphaproteobacteria bacterium]
WYFVLASLVLSLLVGILQAATWLPLAALFHLAILLPSVGMGARRLQDTGRDGRMVWLLFLLMAATQIAAILTTMAVVLTGFLGLIFAPGLGLAGAATLVVCIVLLYFWVQPGDAHENAYGPPPPRFDPAVKPAS